MYTSLPQQLPQNPAQAAALPRRTGALALLISGLVMTFLIAPAVLIISVIMVTSSSESLIGTVDIDSIPKSLTSPIAVGEQLQPDIYNKVTLVAYQPEHLTPSSCEIVSATNTFILNKYMLDSHEPATVFEALSIPQGTYTLKCELKADQATYNFNLYDPTTSKGSILGVAFVGVAISGVIASIGFFLIIGGSIWLVIVNKRRNRIKYAQVNRY